MEDKQQRIQSFYLLLLLFELIFVKFEFIFEIKVF